MRSALRLATAAAAVCAIFAISSGCLTPASAATRAVAVARRPAGVVATAGELINASTGRWMWSRGLNSRRPIASLTKIMTAMVVIGAHDLNRKIKVTEAAERYAEENSAGSAHLHPGDVLTTWQALEAMLLPSGADAAYLLAHTYGPGRKAFVREMNATARSLGMTKTHFANFDGLPWPTPYATYSTPRDLILMGQAAMKLADFRRIVGERHHYIGATRQHRSYYWKNTDLLLREYHGAIGIKTGFTTAAGYCLLFEAERHGKDLMGVVLDSTGTDTTERFTAAIRLLDWGFAR
jgi:D-alanyl-D-alanine carboxypeptidase (penicillin-binding protein 5/6)